MDIMKIIQPKKSTDECYEAGFDCALNGTNEINCHFLFFATKEKMERWEMGKRDGLLAKLKNEKGINFRGA